VKKIITDLRQYGAVQRAVLGISYVELDAKRAKEKGITATKSGILVMSVEDRSTATELGLQENDVIVKINDAEVHNGGQLVEQMNKFRPGDQITIAFYRDNKLMTKTGTLRNNQGNTNITKKGDFSELGCAFMKLSAETKKQLGISGGVQVIGVQNGIFKSVGIKDKFIIMEINNQPVNSSDDIERIYNSIMKSNDSDKVMFIVGLYPNGQKRYYAVDLTAE
jgi:S1-C subfamily serine protease